MQSEADIQASFRLRWVICRHHRPRADLSRKIVLRVYRARVASNRPSRSNIAQSRLASRWKVRVSCRAGVMGAGVQVGALQQGSPVGRPRGGAFVQISSTPAVGRPPFVGLARVSANW